MAAGIKLIDLAAAARIAPSTLSQYLSGQLHNPETQFTIWRRFRRLSGSRITLLEFWGPLLNKEAA
ncbi:MAG: hypothetical protein IMZ44_24760 [Planctomycetes bacterium]|nr:hypothetical protein [Planctomycetota bacterium]